LKPALWLVLALSVASCGCARDGMLRPGRGEMEAPASQQPVVGEAQRRARIHTDLGMAYYETARLAVALEEARKAIESDPAYAPGYSLLGLVHMDLGEGAQAEGYFRQALVLAPGDPETSNNFGWFLCTQKREREGIEHLMTAVKNPLYATPGKPYTNAGLCALKMGDDTAAESYFKRAAQADGRNAQAIFHLANLNFKRGNYYDARRLIGTVQELKEPNAQSLWLALRIERKLGDRSAEGRLANRLRHDFAGTREQQLLDLGQFE
jgi:type IV pilus assembly protein PilF